jgi:two-component system NtrC family sensor kinase
VTIRAQRSSAEIAIEGAHDILVVDDHPKLLDYFARMLASPERPGGDTLASAFDDLDQAPPSKPAFRTHCARQGLDAVALHEQLLSRGTAIAVAFVDLQLPPGIDGIETVKRLWRAQPDLEVVLCTAYPDSSDLARLERRNQVVVLRKPFDPIEVCQLAACLSEKWSRGRALQARMDELEQQVKREVSRRLQLELRDVQKLEELGMLATGIAHEINSPLQYIQSSIELVRDSLHDVAAELSKPVVDVEAARATMLDVPSALDDAEVGIRRVTSIVRSVREYAHTRRHDTFESVDINSQIELVTSLVRAQYRNDVDFVLELAPEARLVGDTDELSRALLNIVVNAAQAIQSTRQPGARGRITIRSRVLAESVMIEVDDTGKGIAREHWDRVFEPFFTTKPRGQGTGQGLPMARAAIVDLHKGALTFDSKPGCGTTFRIMLPRRNSPRITVQPPFVGSAA